MASMCETFHSLPHAGGIMDQDPYLMESMKLVIAARAERHELETNRNKK